VFFVKTDFNPYSLPDLHHVVLDALRLFTSKGVPHLHLGNYRRPIVVGSGNAANTGKILFHDKDAIFGDESNFKEELLAIHAIDGAILISASGGKHAPIIAKFLRKKNIETRLLTCTADCPAKKFIDPDKFFLFPEQREPYTYNVSTYLGMILGKTKEDPAKILRFIEKEVAPKINDARMQKFHSFFIIVPERFDAIREMLAIKFDELFGPKISKRVYTFEQTKHAKTVVPSSTELFISFGEPNKTFGDERARLLIPLPKDADYGAMMAISYYVVGRLQAQHPPWFKQNIVEYCKKSSKDFGMKITPVVE
jgi:hypothetical protein